MPRVGFRAITLGAGPVIAEMSESCTDPSAMLDLAAWSEGSLSPHGMHRLASHVVRCRACQVVLAAVVRDAHAVDSTTKRPCEAERLFEAWAAEQESVHSGVVTLDKGAR